MSKHISTFLSVMAIIYISFALHLYFFIYKVPFFYPYSDTFDQYIIFKKFLTSQYLAGNFEWSWAYSLGGDIFAQFIYYYATSPFLWLSLLWNAETFEQLTQVSLFLSILKFILSGVLFYAFMKQLKRSNLSSLVGAFIYIGSTYLMQRSFTDDFMADAFVYLPLVMIGIERLLQKGRPTLFIVSVCIMVQSSFYFGYITTIYLIIYTLVSFFTRLKEDVWISRWTNGFKVAGYYILGLLLASYSFIPAIYQFLNAYRFDKEHIVAWLYHTEFYYNMPANVFLTISTITIPVIALFFLLVSATKRHIIPLRFLIMTFIMLLFYQSPKIDSMFNGFSAPSFRWVYLLIFSISIISVYVLDAIAKQRTVHPMYYIAYITFFVYAYWWTEGFPQFRELPYGKYVLILHFIMPIVFYIPKLSPTTKRAFIACFVAVIITMQQLYFLLTVTFEPDVLLTRMDNTYRNENYLHTEQQVAEYVKEQEGFHRLQYYQPYAFQTQGFSKHNLGLLFDVPTTASYHSLLSQQVGRFIYEDFKIKQFDSLSHFYNLDERLYIQSFLKADYLAIEDHFAYRPKGYTLVEHIADQYIYQIDYPFPFAYVQTDAIAKEEWDEMSVGMREMLLTQAYVIDDVTTSSSNFDLPTTLFEQTVPFKEYLTDGILHVNGDEQLTIPFTEVVDEHHNLILTMQLKEINGAEFSVDINRNELKKRRDDYIYSLPIDQFAMHIHYEPGTAAIQMQLTEGSYIIRDLKVEKLPLAPLAEHSERANQNAFELVSFNQNSVELKGHAKTDGMLVTTIPTSRGWTATIDGKTVKTKEVNEAFVGVPVQRGEQTIVLTYQSPFLRLGFGITAFTLVFVILLHIFTKQKYKKED